MNKRKRNILGLVILLLLLPAAGFSWHRSAASWRWSQAVSAASAMPYQVGITKAIIVPCFTTGLPPTCEGGTLCSAVDVADCTLYSDVNGMSAGGSGQPPLLLSKVAIGMSGLTMGGQLIYGGTTNSMFLSPNSVLASNSGCFGCTAKAGKVEKIMAWLERLDKYIIAGFKGK